MALPEQFKKAYQILSWVSLAGLIVVICWCCENRLRLMFLTIQTPPHERNRNSKLPTSQERQAGLHKLRSTAPS